MHYYRISGLVTQCPLALPGALPTESADPDVTITAGNVPAAVPGASLSGPTWQCSESQFLLEIPPIGRFLLDHGRRITYALKPGVSDRDLAPFLSGSVFGVLLHQRGNVVLHASAVALGDGRAVVLCGASGVGKSTLAAALTQRGHGLVADDLCSIVLDAGGIPVVHPDGRNLKLWARSIEALGLDQRTGPALRSGFDKFYVEPACISTIPHRIAAIYVLNEAKLPSDGGITPLNVVDATNVVIANAYRPQLVRRMNQRPAYFRIGAALAASAGIYTLTRPLRYAAIADTVAQLEAHWTQTGISNALAPAVAE